MTAAQLEAMRAAVPGYDTLRERYGEPWTVGVRSGAMGEINDRFWAAYYAHEHSIEYDPATDVFMPWGGQNNAMSRVAAGEAVAKCIQAAARAAGVKGVEFKLTYYRLKALAGCLEAMAEKPEKDKR